MCVTRKGIDCALQVFGVLIALKTFSLLENQSTRFKYVQNICFWQTFFFAGWHLVMWWTGRL